MGAPRPRIEAPIRAGPSGARRDLTVLASGTDETS
jgi:hypothetical protein